VASAGEASSLFAKDPVMAADPSTPQKRPILDLIWQQTFSAAHRVHSAHLTAEDNNHLYGKCNNPHFHGHNYTVVVVVRGPVDPVTGMVMDLNDLKGWLHFVVDQLDHKNINLEVPEFLDGWLPATTENIAVWIWQQLQQAMGPQGHLLHRLQLWETNRICVEYSGRHAKL